jgi:hypothetical protein
MSIRKMGVQWFCCRVKKEFLADMFRRLSIALLAATVSVPLSSAQMRGVHAGFARASAGGPHHGTRPRTRRIPLSSPVFASDYDYSDYASSDPYSVEGIVQGIDAAEGALPRVVVVQPASADDSPRKAKPRPLLIEWQGDRYVRFGGADASEETGTSPHPDYAQPLITKKPTSATQEQLPKAPTGELPPAVLVYRDGRREEVADYTIADGVIFVHGNYWQNGGWTKRIPLSALDPPATMRANQERGVRFMLPSAPNMVIASF